MSYPVQDKDSASIPKTKISNQDFSSFCSYYSIFKITFTNLLYFHHNRIISK